MKTENLNRAADLLKMKNTALTLITKNTEALEYIKKYSWDICIYPFDIDMTRQVGGSPNSETKFIKKITIKSSPIVGGNDIVCTIPLDLLIKAVEENIERLKKRVEEIDKEVATL